MQSCRRAPYPLAIPPHHVRTTQSHGGSDRMPLLAFGPSEYLAPVIVLSAYSLSLMHSQIAAQTVSPPQLSLPYQSVGSEDPAVMSTLASSALCSLQSILGNGSSARGIGPLTPCVPTASVNGQTLPCSGIATIFGNSTSSSQTVSIASAQPTTAPLVSVTSTSTSATSRSSAPATSSQPNSGRAGRRPPPGSGWVANQNIVLLLITTFAILAGVTYFLDELLTLLV